MVQSVSHARTLDRMRSNALEEKREVRGERAGYGVSMSQVEGEANQEEASCVEGVGKWVRRGLGRVVGREGRNRVVDCD